MEEPEAGMRPAVSAWLAGRGLKVREEVWIAGRYADVVGYDRETVVAVELKNTDWKGALLQAMAYQLGANLAYVAMPARRAERVAAHREGFERRLVGLMGVTDGATEVLIEARESERLLPFVADGVRRYGRGVRRRKKLPPPMRCHPAPDA